ncbi:MAG TPA: molybdopterin cofactor-binding domain-containing protein [Thermoanaerobaculia bacterium]
MNNFANDLRFYVNGSEVVVRDVDPTTLLVDWLRSPDVGLTGTKKGCDQGGCGACTVMLSRWDPKTKRVERTSINSCLRPIAALDGMEITTTEGTGSSRTELSPVQYRIAKENGSQCGYCTPGFVMNMYSFLAADPNRKATQREIEGLFDGNICRCTGYRAILYGMRHFASDWGPEDEHGCLKTLIDPSEKVKVAQKVVPPAFPPSLQAPPRALHFSRAGYHWYRPLTLAQVHEILREYPDSQNVRLVGGNTSIGVYNIYVEDPHVFIDVSLVPELHGIKSGAEHLTVGAATTYSEFLETLEKLRAKASDEQRMGLDALHFMARHTAGTIVRNAATLAGNTMLVVRHVSEGEPFPSDLFTALSSLNADVHVSVGGTMRTMPILDFATRYQSDPALRSDAVLVRYTIPWTSAREYARTYKTALRKENAHSIVNAGMRVRFDGKKAADVSIILGGIGPLAFHAVNAEKAIRGNAWTNETLAKALAGIRRDVEQNIKENAKRMSGLIYEGFSDAYRLHLAEGYLYQFWIWVADQVAPRSVPKDVRSAAQREPRAVSKGTQHYEKDVTEYPVNMPYVKLGAFLQASGEAQYTHDLPLPRRGVQAAAVTSMQANAKYTYKVPNAGRASARPGGLKPAPQSALVEYLRDRFEGFIDYVTANDVPGTNGVTIGTYADPYFATGTVQNYGQLIGLVLAGDEIVAQRIAQFIATDCIAYQVQDPVLRIDPKYTYPDQNYYPNHIWKIRRPASELRWTKEKNAAVGGVQCQVVTGRQEAGSQLHYYMETQACLAIPGEQDSWEIRPSTQSPDDIVSAVGNVLTIPANKIAVKIQRVGGGYGGKTTRPPWVAAATSVAAWKHARPVRLAVRRENDSAMIGHRHAMVADYAIAIGTGADNPDNRGRILGLSTNFLIDGGSSYDCSFVVSDCLQLRCDTAYQVPNYETSSDVTRTNKASNTAYRTMGLVQAMLAQEDAVEAASHAIGMQAEEVRKKNLYRLGDTTPYGEVLDYCILDDVWKRIAKMADFEKRRAAVESFNRANKWKKRGISMIPVKYASGYNAVFLEQGGALIEVYDQDATVLVRTGGVEIGQGLNIKLVQIAAKELNVPIEIVQLSPTDTQVVPNPVSTGASTGTAFNGGAVKKACRELRSRLEQYAMGLLETNGAAWCKSKNINFWDYETGWRATPPNTKTTVWENLVKMANGDRVNLSAQTRFQEEGGTGVDTGLIFKKGFEGPETVNWFTDFTFSAACTEVEIDVLTGETTVLRSDILYDVGDSINPAIDIGQVEGAFVQGLGYVLSEEVIFQPDGPNKGALNTDNTWRYKMPATTSIPLEFHVDLFPRSDAPGIPQNPHDLYSSKEVGEPPLVLAITAYFAVKRAILAARKDRGHDEWFFLEAPATVQRIREACLVDAKDLTY